MPVITIRLTGSPVTQEQKEELVSRSTDMMRDILHQDPKITGVLIEEVGDESWSARRNSVTHRFRSQEEYERCLMTRWQSAGRPSASIPQTDEPRKTRM